MPDDSQLCVICCNRIEFLCYASCMHPICYVCCIRIRVLCDGKECPICRSVLDKVYMTRKFYGLGYLETRGDRFITDDAACGRSGIVFEGRRELEAYYDLLSDICPVRSCSKYCQNLDELSTHVRREHELQFCDLCVDNLKLFSWERKCYKRKDLAQHRRIGDPDDSSHKGHPICEFCDSRYMDKDHLYRHLRTDHYFCHFCDADGINEFYDVYENLRNHFNEQHFLCEEGACKEEQFTNVFRSEISMKAHKSQAHGRDMDKNQLKQERRVLLEFNYTPATLEAYGGPRRGYRGRGRGGRSYYQGRDSNRQQEGNGQEGQYGTDRADRERLPHDRRGNERSDNDHQRSFRGNRRGGGASNRGLQNSMNKISSGSLHTDVNNAENFDNRSRPTTTDRQESFKGTDTEQDFPTLDPGSRRRRAANGDRGANLPLGVRSMARAVTNSGAPMNRSGSLDNNEFPTLGIVAQMDSGRKKKPDNDSSSDEDHPGGKVANKSGRPAGGLRRESAGSAPNSPSQERKQQIIGRAKMAAGPKENFPVLPGVLADMPEWQPRPARTEPIGASGSGSLLAAMAASQSNQSKTAIPSSSKNMVSGNDQSDVVDQKTNKSKPSSGSSAASALQAPSGVWSASSGGVTNIAMNAKALRAEEQFPSLSGGGGKKGFLSNKFGRAEDRAWSGGKALQLGNGHTPGESAIIKHQDRDFVILKGKKVAQCPIIEDDDDWKNVKNSDNFPDTLSSNSTTDFEIVPKVKKVKKRGTTASKDSTGLDTKGDSASCNQPKATGDNNLGRKDVDEAESSEGGVRIDDTDRVNNLADLMSFISPGGVQLNSGSAKSTKITLGPIGNNYMTDDDVGKSEDTRSDSTKKVIKLNSTQSDAAGRSSGLETHAPLHSARGPPPGFSNVDSSAIIIPSSAMPPGLAPSIRAPPAAIPPPGFAPRRSEIMETNGQFDYNDTGRYNDNNNYYQDSNDNSKNKFIRPLKFSQRNHALFEKIEKSLSSEELFNFKINSGTFRKGELSPQTYAEEIRRMLGPELFREIIPDLLTLLPDIGRQRALYNSVKALLSPTGGRDKKLQGRNDGIDVLSKLDNCSACGQILDPVDFETHVAAHGLA